MRLAGDLEASVRTLSRQKDKQFQAIFTTAIGRVRESDPDKQKIIAAKKLVILNGPVDYEAVAARKKSGAWPPIADAS